MQFYLKASDKDLKQPLENPGDGIILCKSKDKDVGEYALSRNMHLTRTGVEGYLHMPKRDTEKSGCEKGDQRI